MQLLTDVVLLVLLLLIKIGDGVLYFFALLTKYITSFYQYVRDILVNKKFHMLLQFSPRNVSSRQKQKKRKKTKIITVFPTPFIVKLRYFLAGGIFALLLIGIPLLMYTFIQSLPNPTLLADQQVPQTTKIYDRNHTLLYQFYANQNRTMIHLADIPIYLQEGTIAIEDKDFYKHPGFDITAIIRSFIEDISGKKLQGGSTLTQQLIKSTLLTPETSVTRKLKEVILAFWAERIFTKKQILEMYFNQVPYGGTAWGAEAASEVYFGKSVKNLDLAESAFLAGLPQAPTIYSPYGATPTAWKERQHEVLAKMQQLGYISNQQETAALQESLQFQNPQTPIRAPHFVFYVKDYLVKKYGLPLVEKGGLEVVTSLDLPTQDMAQKVVSDEVANDGYLNLTNGAALVTNPANGDILAMVGSKGYLTSTDGAVNLTTSLRQPGSSIKVVTYSAALSRGFTAATILDDSPVTYSFGDGSPSYSPVNYDGSFHGKIPLRLALANSLNIPAVKTLDQIGIPTMVNLAKDMGITTWGDPSNYGLSITLGAAEVKMTDMTVVFGTLANGGKRVDVNPILKVSDAKGNTLEEKSDNEIPKQQVLDPGVAFILSNILSDNNARAMEFGPNSPLTIPGHTVSVKTGTTDSKRDNWTDGYTKNRAVLVWVGNNDNTPMSQTLASGITGAAPIWHQIMLNLLTKTPEQKIDKPHDIVEKPCYGHIEYFLQGTEGSVNCGGYQYATPTKKR